MIGSSNEYADWESLATMEREACRLMEDVSGSYWWYRARAENICSTVHRFVSAGASILDFGCGSGQLSKKLHSQGYEVVAADPDPEILGVCQRNGLATLNLNKQWPEPQSKECVLACDVLEHVEEDVEILRKLNDVLRPVGIVVITVPAYDFLWSGEDHVSGHVRRYRRSQLHRRLTVANFRVVWSSYFNSLLFPLVVAAVVGKRMFRPRDMYKSDIEPLPTWINQPLYRIFSMEELALKWMRFPFGASILVVARRVG